MASSLRRCTGRQVPWLMLTSGMPGSSGCRFPFQQDGNRSIVVDLHQHMGLKLTALNWHGLLLKQLRNPRNQGLGEVGRRGIREAGASTLAGISVDGKLRDQKNRPAGIQHRAVELAGVILEDPQVGDLVSHPPCFELPVAVFFLAKMGLVSHRTLSRNRGYSLVGILIVAAVLTPTGDPFNQLLMAAPLCVLYEISIVVARVFGPKPGDDEEGQGEVEEAASPTDERP